MSGASLTPGQADTLVNRNPVVPARSAGSAHYPFLLPAAEPGELGRLGNYRVLRVLGSGGMGTVFAAEDVALRRPVALKVMHPELAADPDNNGWQRFLREARSLAGIKHRHLVTVYQAFEERGTACLVMELLEGESLEGRLRRTPPPDVAEVVRVGREVAVGLAALHDRGLVHRDVKPGNVWLEAPDGHVKILDLGLVRSAAEEMHLTESGMVVGTPAYMSPEQVRGKAVDARSDLFSLGCVLYTLCTGRPPFEGDTPLARAAALAADEPPPARGLNRAVPRALSDLIAELLAKNPNDRPTTAAEVADRLRDIGRSPEAGEPAPCPSLLRRHAWTLAALPWVVAAGLLAVFGLAGARDKGGSAAAELPAPVASPTPAANPPAPPKKPETVFLADSRDLVIASRLMPHFPPGLDGTVTVRGTRSPHGIFMHPLPWHEGAAGITYRLGQGYGRFAAGVDLNDSGEEFPAPAVFSVYGDGKLLWRSREVTRDSPLQSCDVDVRGVGELRIEVTTADDPMGAHAVWIEPRLTR